MTFITTDPQEDRIPFDLVLPGGNKGASPRGSTYWRRVQSCPREHLLGTLLRWDPTPRAHALDFGLLWHHCLEAASRVIQLNQNGIHTPSSPERAAFDALQPFRDPPGWPEIYEKIGRMLDSYFTRWQGVQQYWQILGVETTLGVAPNGSFYDVDGFPYTSRLDMVIIDHSGVTPVGRSVERKSAWRLEPNLLTGYGQDDQVVGQIYLAERLIDWRALGVYYAGAIIDITTKTKDPSNERVPVYPPQPQVKSWARHKKWWHDFTRFHIEGDPALQGAPAIDTLYDEPYVDDLFPKNYTQCIRRFGRCAFFNFCRERPDENLVQIRRRHETNDLPERFRKLDVVPETVE